MLVQKVTVSLIAVALLGLSGCGHDNCHTDEPCTPTMPQDLVGLTNPLGPKIAPASGQTLYRTYCASCHGDAGKGDGQQAATLSPKPTDLTLSTHDFTDAHLFWRIRDGATSGPKGTGMPSFGGQISEDEIWQLVAHVHGLASGS